jgi:hypothetical protein
MTGPRKPLGGERPVYFTEGIAGEAGTATLEFDYKLGPAVVTSRNALELMRLIGLADDVTSPFGSPP